MVEMAAIIFTEDFMLYFLRSLRFAAHGIYHFFRRERNGKIQGVIGLCTIIAGLFFGISQTEWLALLLCVGLVLSLEMLNSAIERICNMYTTDFHPDIKIIKDVAAAAVLWSAVVAFVIGLLIFIPHVVALFHLSGN